MAVLIKSYGSLLLKNLSPKQPFLHGCLIDLKIFLAPGDLTRSTRLLRCLEFVILIECLGQIPFQGLYRHRIKITTY
jgi:hypothetical protein